MVDVSIGCVNDDTYGVSCVHCGKCGRKFSINGIDDSKVIPNKYIDYKDGFDIESLIEQKIEINEIRKNHTLT